MSWPMAVVAIALSICLVLVIALVRTDPPERSQPLQISTSEWLPYISPDLPDGGPVAELLSEVFGRAGYTPEFTYSTWPLAERDVSSGATVGMAPVVVSDSREDFALYTDPLLDFRYTLFGRQGELLNSLPQRSDLNGVRVARIEGYQYWSELEGSGARFTDYPSSLAAFTAVQEGEADLVAEGSIAGRAVLTGADFAADASGFAEVAPATPMTSSTQGLYLLIKDTSEGRRLQREFNAALAAFRTTEDYQQLLATLTDTSTDVTLTAAEGGAVNLLDEEGEPAGSTPSGTAASVGAWPEGTLGPHTLVTVKILEGPLAGRFLTARLDDLEITHA